MNELDKKKLLSGAIVCALVVGAVAFVQRFPPVSDFLTAPAGKSAGRVNLASSTKAATGQRLATTLPAVASTIININTAGKDEFMTLHGIGPSKADAILLYRSVHGTFYRSEDIMNVSGIGKAMYESFRDDITVGNVGPPSTMTMPPQALAHSSAVAYVATSSAPGSAAHVVISQIMAGVKGNAGYEYIELYNTGTNPADLDAWNIKKKTSTGSVSTLISSSHFGGKIIPAGKHFLLASIGYSGELAPDVVWPSSYTFARSNNAIILYNGTGQAVETVAWEEIPEGKSYTRVALNNQNFIVADPQPHNSSN